LLSARDYLYISYIGQSVKDNETLPPSAIIDELLDYIETAASDPQLRENMIIKQPLHGFSSQYNNSESALYTYLGNTQDGLKNLQDSEKPRPEFSFEEVSLESFSRFFADPFKFYYNTVLDVRYDDHESLLPETEIFELDNLQKWQLRERMLSEAESTVGELKNRLLKTGQLPLKNMSAIEFNGLAEEVSKMRKLLRAAGLNTEFDQLDIEFQLGDTLITGSIPLTQGKTMVVISFSKKDIKYFLRAYIQFLCGVAAGVLEEVYFVSGKYETVYHGTRIAKKDAQIRLEELLSLYKLGHQRILPFLVELQQKPADVLHLKTDTFKNLADDMFSSGYNRSVENRYVLNEIDRPWFQSTETGEEFIQLCKILVAPIGALFPTAKFNGE
jgi:exodeoxyribonuclease V gamma subunit